MDDPRKKKIFVLSRAANETFTRSEWTEVGYLTGAEAWIDRHPRLYRSLYWGDDDYKGCVMDAVAHILDSDPQNLRRLVEYGPIRAWLQNHERGYLEELLLEIQGTQVPEAVPQSSNDAGFAALADAQALLRERGPASAVDRIHTGLHAFLKASCDKAAIACPADATANHLLKLLLDQHPNLGNLGPRGEDIKRMVRSGAAIVDAMGTLRNKVSLAHPNETLLNREEALLVIHLGRSLLHYLDAKLSEPTP